MERNHLLLINDMCGYGKVATAAMLPILSYMGVPTFNLPTALVSNTLDYGKFNILDTTDYIVGVLPVWRELGFRFDAIATGFIASERQADIISKFCSEMSQRGTTIFVDPIMGDEGKLYNGVGPSTIQSMREMVAVAGLTYPNFTEACYLTGTAYRPEGVGRSEATALLDGLSRIGAKAVLITSIIVDGQHCVAGRSKQTGDFLLPYDEIPVHFPGTGDIFSAVLIGGLFGGLHLRQATQKAMTAVYRLINLNKDNADKNSGIPIENYLNIVLEA